MMKRIVLLYLILNTSIALAGSPFLTNDPVVLDYHHWELYLFSNLDKNHVAEEEPDLNAPAIEFNFGVVPNLEFHLLVPYAWSLPSATPAANGIGDIETGFEYRFIQGTKTIPQVAIYPVVEIPAGYAKKNLGNGKAWVKLPIWLQKSWGSWTMDAGGGYAINPGKDMRNYPFAGCLLQKDIDEKLTLGAEMFAQGVISVNSQAYMIINVGAVYNFTKQFNLLFSMGHSIVGEQHLVSYLGLHWTV